MADSKSSLLQVVLRILQVLPSECQIRQKDRAEIGSFDLNQPILGIDIGEARIGVAINDSIGFGAHALCTLQSKGRRRDVEAVARLVEEYQVAGIVVGIPYLLDGSVGIEADKAYRFAEALEEVVDIDVFTWDERLTTAEAERILLATDVSRRKRRQVIDQVAAALMLESFLGFHRSRQRS